MRSLPLLATVCGVSVYSVIWPTPPLRKRQESLTSVVTCRRVRRGSGRGPPPQRAVAGERGRLFQQVNRESGGDMKGMLKGVAALELASALFTTSAQAQGVQFGVAGSGLFSLEEGGGSDFGGSVLVGFGGGADSPIGFRIDGTYIASYEALRSEEQTYELQ